MKISAILKLLDQHAPESSAEDWDNVGLLAGDPNWETTQVVTAIDLTPEALDLALDKKASLIITHHPAIFRAVKNLTVSHSGELSTLIVRALSSQIAIAAYHTNFDLFSVEAARDLAGALGFNALGRLLDDQGFVKLTVFVPESHLEAVRSALCQAGAGKIGHYDECTFQVSGQGRFRALQGADPFLGSPGEIEKVNEIRLETLVPDTNLPRVLSAMRKAHPYEEIAYDLIRVEQKVPQLGLHPGLGYGVFGEFPEPLEPESFFKKVREHFKVPGLLVTGPTPRVKRVGFVPGKGSSFVRSALRAKVDVFLTGELGYHDALSAMRKGICTAEIGHAQSEVYFSKILAQWLGKAEIQTLSLNPRAQRFIPNLALHGEN